MKTTFSSLHRPGLLETVSIGKIGRTNANIYNIAMIKTRGFHQPALSFLLFQASKRRGVLDLAFHASILRPPQAANGPR